ncbi:uncharacterized protein [Amphiura filiformis]|uniref:uncharacterized protein n=1 Tax=Amphiura filiformis TaxID=82378 RepID=UPI003B21D180
MAATNYGLVVFFADYPKAIRRGEIALKSNHLVSFKFDNNTGKFLGTVQASQRNKNYKVEVDLNDDGTVCGARCECARGMHKCHHMGAVLLHGIKSVSSTDKLCTWNRQAVVDSVRTVDEIFPPTRPFNPLQRQPNQEDRNFYRAKLKLDGVTCGMRWLLAPEPKKCSATSPNC